MNTNKTEVFIQANTHLSASQIANQCGVSSGHVHKIANALGIELPKEPGPIQQAIADVFSSDGPEIIRAMVYFYGHTKAARILTVLIGRCITADTLRYHTNKIESFSCKYKPSPEIMRLLKTTLLANHRTAIYGQEIKL